MTTLDYDGAFSEQNDAEDHASPPPQSAYRSLRRKLAVSDSGAVLATHANLAIILRDDPLLTGLVNFDAFTLTPMIKRSPPVLNSDMPPSPGPYPRPLADKDVFDVLAFVQQNWASNFKRSQVEEALHREAERNEVHQVRNWLDSLPPWNGEPFLDQWLTRTFGCPLDDYHKAVGSKILIAAVRRVRQPGCKFDHMLVLEGKQGIGKSTAVSILFGQDWFADQISDLSSKDSGVDLRGKWAIEFGEVDRIIRTEVETARAFLSRASDYYRPPYGRRSMDHPRQCVFIGTTNEDDYLRDPAGNRRYWPVRCLSKEFADLDWLRENRERIWSEAVAREAAGEPIFLDQPAIREMAKQAQSERMADDAWQQRIELFLTKKTHTTVMTVMDECLSIPTAQQSKTVQMRIANVLRGMGWCKTAKWDAEHQKTVKAWWRTDEPDVREQAEVELEVEPEVEPLVRDTFPPSVPLQIPHQPPSVTAQPGHRMSMWHKEPE